MALTQSQYYLKKIEEDSQIVTIKKKKKQEDDSSDEDEEEGDLEMVSSDNQVVIMEGGDELKEKRKDSKKETKELTFKWWIKASIVYAFRHPLVTARLEKLMGSNVVQLTDREYMQKLQRRILEDYALSAEKRIKAREVEEMERVKNLVLTGKVPFANAPPEMYDHPVMVIEMYCQKLIAERRAKIKVPKVNIPNHLYWDDTIDPPSGLSIEKGHMFRDEMDRICIPPERYLYVEDVEDIELGYMLKEAEFQTLRYEDRKIKELRECQNVEDLYRLSDELIGILKTMERKGAEADAPAKSSFAAERERKRNN